MRTATRWAATLRLAWDPVIAYQKRRQDLLDWIEDELTPVSFLDENDRVGLAIGNMAQRLESDRFGVSLKLASRTAKAESLLLALSGTLDVMNRPGPRLHLYRGSWSVDVSTSYEDACRSLAGHLPGARSLDLLGSPFDGAVLVDVRGSKGSWQIEYGVVTAEELASRVDGTTEGQLGRNGFVSNEEERLEGGVFVYADASWSPHGHLRVSALDALAAFEEREEEFARFIAGMAQALELVVTEGGRDD